MMKFKVTFGERGSAYHALTHESGLEDVRRIRRELEASLPLDRICGEVKSNEAMNHQHTISISEEFAEKSQRFSKKCGIFVEILNTKDYWYKEVECRRNEETGEVLMAWVQYVLDRDKLLAEWSAQGYPSKMLHSEFI